MKFKRIDEDTVCCLLTEEDIQDYGLETQDFLMDREKVHGFLETLVEQAKEEVGYESRSGMLAMQIAVLPDNGVAITFSEKEEDNVRNMIEQIMNGNKMLDDIAGRFMEEREKAEKASRNADSYIYCFENFETLENFCNRIQIDKPIKSRLYKDKEKNKFYLLLRKGKLSKKEFEFVEQLASEFAAFISNQNARIMYMEEHYQCMIKKKAVNVIQSM